MITIILAILTAYNDKIKVDVDTYIGVAVVDLVGFVALCITVYASVKVASGVCG